MTRNERLPYEKVLVIDTHQRDYTSVALIQGDDICLSEEKLKAQSLPKMIDNILKSEKLLPANIDAYGLMKKDGSLTAIRIGTATINTLSWLNKKPVIEVAAENIQEACENILNSKVIRITKTSLPLA